MNDQLRVNRSSQHQFSIRLTRDTYPQVMVDCVVLEDGGWRLYSIPMWKLWGFPR